jgi:rubrerythrin
MELGTFGAIISFALELEEQTFNYYENIKLKGLSNLTSQLLSGSQKRIRRLVRIRQELVTEMILEPITGVDRGVFEVSTSQRSDEVGLLNQAILLEENLHNYYSNTASLIPMKEVERAFFRLAAENEKRIASIQNSISN